MRDGSDEDYPLVPQGLIVGITPAKARQFAPAEVVALLEAFEAHTGVDPLADGVKLHEVMSGRKPRAAPI